MTAQSPPQSIEAEKAVLGAMMVSAGALTPILDEVELSDGDFYFDRHRTIFSAIASLHRDGSPVDELSVIAALSTNIDQAGGKHYVSELAAKVPAPGNAKHYAESVLRDSLTREKREIGQHLTNGLPPAEAIEQLLALEDRNAAADPSSWTPVDLAAALAGDDCDPPPTILARSDGVRLLYAGRLHQVSAEPEAGKGWLALRATADLLAEGATVVYIDFESAATEIVSRLLALQVDSDHILNRLVYLRPHEPLAGSASVEFDAALAREPVLIVIDGVTEALTIHGLDLGDNADVARWLELLPRPGARSGAAVLMIDHVVKDKEARGRYAIGAQHKLAGIDVAYSLEVVDPFGRGKSGLVKVKVNKDRPGHVRQHAEGEQVALMRLGSNGGDGSVTVTFDPPDGTDDDGRFRPTVLMERISLALEQNPGMTNREIRELGGNAKVLDDALKLLLAEGFVDFAADGRAHRHRSLRPFRNSDGGAS